MSSRIVRTTASPLQILSALERARAALDAGDVAQARQYVEGAHSRLALAKASQDTVLDESAQTPERPAGEDRQGT
jgi:hypothetical protein